MIRLDGVTVGAGPFLLSGISLEVPPGAYGVLMGRTGAGKTTLMEAICGLKKTIKGRVELNGEDVTGRDPGERGAGYVPQDLALFRSMSVYENLAFALAVRKWSKAAARTRVHELAELLGIGGLLSRRTADLSGGEAQRVALGRAIAARPAVLLLDEPLSALDEPTRQEMHRLLKSVQRQAGMTTLHITHSRDEAVALADRMLVLENGAVREVGGF